MKKLQKGPFMIVNALPTEFSPGEKFRILVKFTPDQPVQYHETYVISTFSDKSETKLHVNLRAKGLGPKWVIEGAENEMVHFGITKINTPLQQPIFLTNNGDFALDFSFDLKSRVSHENIGNRSGKAVFNVIPKLGKLAPGERKQILVSFSADHIGNFTDEVRLRLFESLDYESSSTFF